MGDAESEDIQRATTLSIQGAPVNNLFGGPSNAPPDTIPTTSLPLPANTTSLPPPTSILTIPPPLPKLLPKEVNANTLSQEYDPTSLAHLQAMLGDPKAMFRSPAQYYLYKSLLGRDCHLVSVSATGSGKTLPFQLAMKSWDRDVRGIMVLPYQVLHGDMKRRMVEVGLSCSKWA